MKTPQKPYLLAQPVRVLDAGHRVAKPLHGGWDGDDLLDGAAQALPVVVPIHQRSHIRLLSSLCKPWPVSVGPKQTAFLLQ